MAVVGRKYKCTLYLEKDEGILFGWEVSPHNEGYCAIKYRSGASAIAVIEELSKFVREIKIADKIFTTRWTVELMVYDSWE